MALMDKISNTVESGKKAFMSAISGSSKAGSLIDKEDHKAWTEYKASGGELSSKVEWIKAGKPEVGTQSK